MTARTVAQFSESAETRRFRNASRAICAELGTSVAPAAIGCPSRLTNQDRPNTPKVERYIFATLGYRYNKVSITSAGTLSVRCRVGRGGHLDGLQARGRGSAMS